MGHIVLGAPPLGRFHLMERLGRELTARGHRVTVLCLDAVDFAFWSEQGLASTLVAPGAQIRTHAPLAEFAEIDCRRPGEASPPRQRQRARKRLARLLPGLLRVFDNEAPDLVLMHQRRTGAHALLQFVARECGARVLWTGTGLLPGTMQLDEEGIDGDARLSRRSAWDFRDLGVDREFLSSALAAVAGCNEPPPLSRRTLKAPSLWARVRAAVAGSGQGTDPGLMPAIKLWEEALPPVEYPPGNYELPDRPFAAVLLQNHRDPRLRLDAVAPPSPAALTFAARAAVQQIERDMPVVAVLPREGLLGRQIAPLRRLASVRLEVRAAAIPACIAASVVFTVNDDAAATALLSDTPVVHFGRALYGIPGVATRATLDTLGAKVREAMTEDQPELRRRMLGWTLAHGHVWCSVDHPDHNGLSGLILQIEKRVSRRSLIGGRLRYRAGPAWPLAAEGS